MNPRGQDRAGEPLVSVIIPCFNQAHYLGDAIESVRRQRHGSWEIVVVDDGSTDDTAGVAAGHGDVRLVRQANAGLSAARNAGMAASSGEYLVFLDADDRLLPNALRDGLRCLDEHPHAAFASGRYRFIRADGSAAGDGWQERRRFPAYEQLLRGNYIGMHATVMYRRRAIVRSGGFDPSRRSCEDYDLYLRIAREEEVASHDEFVAEYRRHAGGMSLDAGRMLAQAVATLAAQRPFLAGHPSRVAACRVGLRTFVRDMARPLLAEIRAAAVAGQWPRVFGLARGIPGYLRPAARAGVLYVALGLEQRRGGPARHPA